MFLIKWNRFGFDDHPGRANVACFRLQDSGKTRPHYTYLRAWRRLVQMLKKRS